MAAQGGLELLCHLSKIVIGLRCPARSPARVAAEPVRCAQPAKRVAAREGRSTISVRNHFDISRRSTRTCGRLRRCPGFFSRRPACLAGGMSPGQALPAAGQAVFDDGETLTHRGLARAPAR